MIYCIKSFCKITEDGYCELIVIDGFRDVIEEVDNGVNGRDAFLKTILVFKQYTKVLQELSESVSNEFLKNFRKYR